MTTEVGGMAQGQTILIHNYRQKNQGAGGPWPPRFQNICFRPGPPRFHSQKLTNIGYIEITFKHVVQFLKYVTFMRFYARGLCIHSYMEIKALIHNSRFPILFSPPPGCDMFLRLCNILLTLVLNGLGANYCINETAATASTVCGPIAF